MTATGPRALHPGRPSAMALLPPVAVGTEPPPKRPQERAWETGQLRTLAWRSCTHCSGTGGEGSGIACACVWETIFRICYARYRRALAHPPNRVQLPRFEVVDFEIVARRALQPPEWKSFHRHFILGDPRQAVAPEATLKVAQALFDHNVYVRRPR